MSRQRKIGLGLALFLLIGGGCSKPPDELYDEAVVAASRGDLPKAERKLRVVVRRDPEFVDAHFQLARIFEQTDRTSEAAQEYEKVVALRPTYSAALFRLAEIHFKNEEFGKALEQLRPMLGTEAVFSMQEKVQAARLNNMIAANKKQKEHLDELLKRFETDPSCGEELADAHHEYGKRLVDCQEPQRAIENQEKGSAIRVPIIESYKKQLEKNQKRKF